MIIEDYLYSINEEIELIEFGEHPKELYEPINYIMSLDGKRSRPVLCLLAYHLFDYDWQNALRPSIALEVFHNFTLMHDDIMDEAPIRRGKETVHVKWGNNRAILSGDAMLINAYRFFDALDNDLYKKVILRFNETAIEVCEGQQLDMDFASKTGITEDQYLNMIRLKTSVLIGFSMELGGIVAREVDDNTKELFEIGVNLGMGFQLQDDFLDVYGDPKKFGKQVGGDIIENKNTWLLIKAKEFAKGTPYESELNDWLDKKDFIPSEKVEAIKNIYTKLNIDILSQELMDGYFLNAMKSIEKLPALEERKKDLIDYVNQLSKRQK